MELKEVIDHARNEQKSELAKQIAEKLVILGSESIKYVKEGKYSFNHGKNVGQSKAFSWVLEQLKAKEVEKEAKEVDLDEEIEKCLKQHNMLAVGKKEFTNIAKHFFELGLKAQQEPVSEELEEEISRCIIDEDMNFESCARHFANWQKEKDVKLIFNAKDDGYRLGLATMKRQMMEDAVDAKVCNKAYPTNFEIETNTFIQKLNHGDNVKLIIIKED